MAALIGTDPPALLLTSSEPATTGHFRRRGVFLAAEPTTRRSGSSPRRLWTSPPTPPPAQSATRAGLGLWSQQATLGAASKRGGGRGGGPQPPRSCGQAPAFKAAALAAPRAPDLMSPGVRSARRTPRCVERSGSGQG